MKRKKASEAIAQDHIGIEIVTLSIFSIFFLERKLSRCFGSGVAQRFTITRINLGRRGFNNTDLDEPESSLG